MGKNVMVWSPQIGDLELTAALLSEILGGGQSLSEAAVSATSGTTLTAAQLLTGQIARTGPTAAFSDATDTAANIITALGGFVVGQSFTFNFKNATTWPATLTAGSGVTMASGAVISPNSTGLYFAFVGGTAASPTVTFKHIGDVPARLAPSLSNPQATALSTVGAGTLTAALMETGAVIRGGTQVAAFADTTDTVANIIAGMNPLGLAVGASQKFLYVNGTTFPATITGASNVTITGQAVVPANSWVEYIVTQTSGTAITFQAIRSGYFPTSGTVTANATTPVVVANTAVTAGSNIILTYKSGSVGATGAFVEAITPGTSFTIKSVASDTAVYNYTILG